MGILRVSLASLVGIFGGFASAKSPAAATFELKDGDRVVFLGNSFFERALDHGHLEASLALRWPERNITFRNLGWDGDTVYGHSRAGGRRRAVFGDPEEGFSKMIAHLKVLDPTVVFLAYGWNESFDGEGGVERFRKGLERLLKETAGLERRFILLAPTPAERGFGTDLPFAKTRGPDHADYVTQRNAILKRYRDVIASAAKARGHHFVDLLGALQNVPGGYSANGIHPSDQGYLKIARIMAQSLKLPEAKIDLQSERAQSLRATIVKKNALYFHRWRPRNDAFVYGERKNEQVIAQTEPEKFEPLVVAQEKEIREQLEGIK